MTDAYDPFDNLAVDRTIGTLEDPPEDAARAIDLGNKTGANPVAIHADIESFENNVKAATTAQLIRGNRHISDYINSHPLAGIVSNGDLHNLDEASGKMKVLPKGKSAVEKDFGESVGSIAVQWGGDFWDSLVDTAKSFAAVPKDINQWTVPEDEVKNAAVEMAKNPDWANTTSFLGAVNNALMMSAGKIPGIPVNLGAQDLAGGIFGAIGTFTGVLPTLKTAAHIVEQESSVPAAFTEQVAMLGMMFLGARTGKGKAHVSGGEIPPPGMSKEVDTIREHRSKENLRALDEATKSIQSSSTNQLAPDLAREFAGQHVEDRSVYVSVDAIKRLYGDKAPAAEDGILGWVEGLGERIQASEEVGKDIAIPLKDWLTKIDPEIAKALHDDTRVTKDDVTNNEAKRYKELEPEAKPEDEKPGVQNIDLSRRGFLKGAGAVAATAATGKVPKLEAPNPFAAADLSMFQKNVEFSAAEQFGFAQKIYGEQGPVEAAKTLQAMATRLKGEGSSRMFEEAAKLIRSGWVPPQELLDQVSKVGRGEGPAPSEMTKKIVEQDHLRLSEAEEISSLPWPEEYMKGDYPKGLTEPSVRETMHRHQEAIDETRDAYHLRPSFAKSKEVKLEITDTFDQPEFEDQSGNKHKAGKLIDINLKDDEGNPLGSISVITGEDFLHVDYAHNAEFQPWQHGFNQMEVLLRTAKELYLMFPETEGIGGHLVSREKYVKYTWDELFGPKTSDIGIADLKERYLNPPFELGPSRPTGVLQSPKGKRFTTDSLGSTTIRSAFEQMDLAKSIGGPIAGALDHIAKKISEKVGNVQVHVIKEPEWEAMREGARAVGFYDPISNSIAMSEKEFRAGFNASRMFFHEAIHAATVREILRNPTLNARIQLVMNEVKTQIGEKYHYGMTDTREFIAEALSNRTFQKELAGIQISEALATHLGVREHGLVKTLWDLVIHTIAKGLGLANTPHVVTAFEAAIRVSQEAFDKQLTIHDRVKMLQWKMNLSAADEAPKPSPMVTSDRFKSPWGYANYPVDAEQHIRNLKTKIGQLSRDLTEFNKQHPDEPHENRQKLREFRQELKDLQAEQKLPESSEPTAFRGKAPGIAPMAKQPELPGMTRIEDRKAFATPTAVGINKEWYNRYQDLIAKQQGEDAKRQMEIALKRAEQVQTKEWKDNSDRISKEVEAEIRARPDVGVDEALRKGTLGEGTRTPGSRRLRLNAEELTEEQKGVLDPSEYSLDGIHPDDLAGYFGFPSGDAMLERLAQFREFVKETYASSEAFVKAATREETAKRMEKEFGDLGQKILEEARDHVTSETQLDLMHEELVGAAMQAGMEFSLTKDDMKAIAKRSFDKHTMGDVTTVEYLKLAAKHGMEMEKAALDENWKGVFKAKQMQTLATMMAAEAKKVEKAKKVWDRNTKRFAKREVSGIDQRYTNAIHDIMFRTDSTPRPRRTPTDLVEAFRRDGWSDISPLKDFVEDRMEAFRELAVPEWLQDPRFEKDFDRLTTKEFMEAHDAIKSLIKNGRDEQKVFSEGNAADLAEVFEGMRDQIKDLPIQEDRIDRPQGRIAKWIGTSFWAHVNIESMMNRLDRGNIQGLFKKYIMRPIAEASNAKDAMMKKYQGEVSDLGKIKDMDKLVENNLFIDPRGDGKPFIMRKRNVLGILQNVGNVSNLEKLAKGYDISPENIMKWLKRNTTKEDWDRAQKIGKMFEDLFEQGARMQHELTGIAPVKVPLQPFIDPFGTVRDGWYNPVKYDRKRPGNSPKLMGRSALEDEGYFRATVPTGFLTERTGYVAPMELNLDIVPVRMRQMIHDITMRPSIIQASKFFYNPEFNRMIRKAYGDKPVEEFVPFLRDVANSPNFVSFAEQVGNEAMEFFRQNLISTLIGLNPGTVMKHGTTALLNSLQQMGYRDFAHEFFTLAKHDSATGKRNWSMAMEKSEELQRRMRNFKEIIAGHGVEINIRGGKGGSNFDSFREVMMQMGATPVATSDLLSSVPTWLTAYKRAKMAGETEGEAIYRGDLAVRQTHGSSVMSNKPSVMRTNAFGALYTSLYGFFSHMFQKQYEMAWKAKDAYGLAKAGEYAEGAKRVPELASLFLSYVILPAVIEELVTPYTNSEKDSWGKKIAKTLAFGVGSSMIGVRDFVHGFINVRDPSAGLVGTMFKTISDVGKDLGRGSKTMTDPARQAKLANHALSMFGLLTGLTNASEGKMVEYFWRVNNGLERPKGPWELLTGARYGTTKGHSKTMEEYGKHLKGH